MSEKMFFFDLETTGLKYHVHGIHQLAGCIRIDGVVKEFFDIRMMPAPECEIDLEALAISGLTKKDILKYQPEKEAYFKIIALLEKYVDRYNKQDKFIMVGYNNNTFDNEFMRQFFYRNKDAFFGAYFWADTLDCRVLAMASLKDIRPTMENFKQSTVAKQLGIKVDMDRLHEAQYDVEILMAIYDDVMFKEDLF